MRSGKACVCTRAGFSSCMSISTGSIVQPARCRSPKFRRAKRSSTKSNATHVFIVRNGDLATSRIVACPEGITRATVIEISASEKIRCIETDLSVVDVYGADEMFCTGTMGELAAVTKIDNRVIGDGKVGAITKRLSDLYAQRTATEGVQVVDL